MKAAESTLAESVRGVLVDISRGIISAQDDLGDTNVRINPFGVVGGEGLRGGANRVVERVTFDVAVSSSGTREGGVTIGVLSAALGAKGSITDTKGTVSRVQSAIPVIWPCKPGDKQPAPRDSS